MHGGTGELYLGVNGAVCELPTVSKPEGHRVLRYGRSGSETPSDHPPGHAAK